MDDLSLFKSAIPPTSSEIEVTTPFDPDKTDHVIKNSDLPPSLYREAGRVPYIADFLQLGPYYHTLDTKNLTDAIDGFIVSEMKRLHLKDSIDTYTDLARSYVKKLHLENIDDPFLLLEKINRFTHIQRQLLQSSQEYDELMAMDISEMSAHKMKKWMELKYGIKST